MPQVTYVLGLEAFFVPFISLETWKLRGFRVNWGGGGWRLKYIPNKIGGLCQGLRTRLWEEPGAGNSLVRVEYGGWRRGFWGKKTALVVVTLFLLHEPLIKMIYLKLTSFCIVLHQHTTMHVLVCQEFWELC